MLDEFYTLCFSDSIPYIIGKSSTYLKLRASNILNTFDTGLTIEQFVALETIVYNNDICQRDLSKILLKDRSNVTRILTILEKKNLIKRLLELKSKRVVKKIYATHLGKEIINNYSVKLRKNFNLFFDQFSPEELENLKNTLNKINNIISKEIKIQI